MMPYTLTSSFSLRLVRERSVRYPLPCVQTERQGALLFREYLKDRDVETMAVALVDGRNHVVGVSVVSTGGIASVAIAIRDVLKFAIVGRAHAFMVAHNHPSGDTHPSAEDDAFTAKLKQAAEVLGIPFLDHLIVSSGYDATVPAYSYFAQGKL